MTVDADRWRERGRHLRAVESVRLVPRMVTREVARDLVRVGLAAALRELSEAEREAAVANAVEGYVTEHRARGGPVEDL